MMAKTGSLKFVCDWKVETGLVCVDTGLLTVLQIEAVRECKIKVIKVAFPRPPDHLYAQMTVREQAAAIGHRLLRVERHSGPSCVIGRENLINPDLVGQVLIANDMAAPHDYWFFSGSIELTRGAVLGVVVKTNQPCACKVLVAGNR